MIHGLSAHVDTCQEIENLNSLKALEELWLGKNKITEIQVP